MASWREMLGNVILDLEKYRQEHGHKWPIGKLLLGSFLLWVVRTIHKSRATRVTSITPALANSPYLYKLRCQSYDPNTGKISGSLLPVGVFATLLPKGPRCNCEVELAHCAKLTTAGHDWLRGIIKDRGNNVYLRVDEVMGPQCIIKGFLYARLRGRLRKVSINEELLKAGLGEYVQQSWEEASEQRLDRQEELRLSEVYAKLTGQGKWHEYYKSSAHSSVVGTWLEYKTKVSVLRNRRLLRQVFL